MKLGPKFLGKVVCDCSLPLDDVLEGRHHALPHRLTGEAKRTAVRHALLVVAARLRVEVLEARQAAVRHALHMVAARSVV